MGNVVISEDEMAAIQTALNEADKFYTSLERLAQTARPIRRDDIFRPILRMALNDALNVKWGREAATSARRKK